MTFVNYVLADPRKMSGMGVPGNVVNVCRNSSRLVSGGEIDDAVSFELVSSLPSKHRGIQNALSLFTFTYVSTPVQPMHASRSAIELRERMKFRWQGKVLRLGARIPNNSWAWWL